MTLAKPTRARRTGLTMIELVMVCVILAIVAGVALPRLQMNRYRADAAGQLVRMMLQTAQRNAITRQSNVIISYDVPNNGVRMVQDYNNNDTINTGDKVDMRHLEEGAHYKTPTWRGIKGTVPTGPFTMSDTMTVGLLPSTIFRRDGSASGDLELYVTMRDNVPNEYRGLIVTGTTGRVDLYKYNGTSWIRMSQ